MKIFIKTDASFLETVKVLNTHFHPTWYSLTPNSRTVSFDEEGMGCHLVEELVFSGFKDGLDFEVEDRHRYRWDTTNPW